MEYFDYQSVARDAGITAEDLARLIERVRRDFPCDQMLRELHVLRMCRAILRRRVTLQQALAEPSAR